MEKNSTHTTAALAILFLATAVMLVGGLAVIPAFEEAQAVNEPIKKRGKVTICHVPPGNPDNAHTVTVSRNALDAHLAHGDYKGPCKDRR
jgi:hypothetical protein